MSGKLTASLDKSGRNFLIVFLAVLLLIFGGGIPLVLYGPSILGQTNSTPPLTTCNCSLTTTSSTNSSVPVNFSGIPSAYYCPTSSCEAVPTTTLSFGGTTYASTVSGSSKRIPPVQCAVPVSLSSSSPNIVQTATGIVQLNAVISNQTAPNEINGTLIQVCADRNISCIVSNVAFKVTFSQVSCSLQQSVNVCTYSSNHISVPSVSQTNHYASLSFSIPKLDQETTYEIGTP
jgi:hypothetical protein